MANKMNGNKEQMPKRDILFCKHDYSRLITKLGIVAVYQCVHCGKIKLEIST